MYGRRKGFMLVICGGIIALSKQDFMKIATYNIWNSESGMPYRSKYTINEIQKINADILCLQEVHNKEMAESIAVSLEYQYCFFDN